MKLFKLGDVLCITTGRLVSDRHIDGVYDILDFMTGDSLFTHQLPRAADECRPWLAAQYPQLMPDSSRMAEFLSDLETLLLRAGAHPETSDYAREVCALWVERVRTELALPAEVPVYELGADMHTHIDPLEEAKAMVGDDRVIPLEISPEGNI